MWSLQENSIIKACLHKKQKAVKQQMENRINYQKELDKIISEVCKDGKRPTVFLHSCCGPCSSYVLEYLTKYFDIILYFYNPNIQPESEYIKRLNTQKEVLERISFSGKITLIKGEYRQSDFFNAVKGLENEPEGGKRCEKCISLRLKKAAETAMDYNADFFATTLTVSPHKNAVYINKVGNELEESVGIAYLLSDFKKKNGYKRSIELCRQFDIYRQNYCGCIYSKH